MRWEEPTWKGPFYGQLGVLAYEDGKAVCHICGETFAHLGAHVHHGHGLRADEYRRAFGLKQRTKLIGPDFQQKRRELATRVLQNWWDEARRRARGQPEEIGRRYDRAARRREHELSWTEPERLRAAHAARWGTPSGRPQRFWAQVAVDFVSELGHGARGVYRRLAQRWEVGENSARWRVQAARQHGMIDWTGVPYRPAGSLTPKARQLLAPPTVDSS